MKGKRWVTSSFSTARL
ncbi:hypothetical protein [Parabacteroides distasonis]